MSTLSDLHNFHKNIFEVGYASTSNDGKFNNYSIPAKIRIVGNDMLIHHKNIKLTSDRISLSYEALIPLLSTGGQTQYVLLFIIAYCANKHDNTFKWNRRVEEEYCELYRIITGKKINIETPRKAIWKLTKKNIITMTSKENYVLNPLCTPRPFTITGGKGFLAFLQKALIQGASLVEALYIKTSQRNL